MRDNFSHVSDWVFDLDNTLYPPAARLFDQIEVRMTDYVMRSLNVARPEADRLRNHYWSLYGTTLAGLMREHSVDPTPYLEDVHEISLDHLTPDPDLADAIRNLPGRKIVYTNGTAPYAHRVTEARGLSGLFDGIYGVEDADFLPKPEEAAYRTIFAKAGIEAKNGAMFEDDPRNLRAPHAMGLQTVLVTPLDPDAPPRAAYVHYHTHDLAGFLQQLV
ncbi:pyrimidine 5'-nucleotidase [Albirhodobacter sp. R86504]|jgi:putative hydrolase of the HAD superfamily|uniref:pyrimidine 5'-nucleotidase n=1 Tax=Albirhodobacter sp. R86504 TaxID=3093848 RepID=UPI00366AD5FF